MTRIFEKPAGCEMGERRGCKQHLLRGKKRSKRETLGYWGRLCAESTIVESAEWGDKRVTPKEDQRGDEDGDKWLSRKSDAGREKQEKGTKVER